MWYSGKPRLWKENNRPYIPTCNMVGIVLIKNNFQGCSLLMASVRRSVSRQ